jgi:hypothetical protein
MQRTRFVPPRATAQVAVLVALGLNGCIANRAYRTDFAANRLPSIYRATLDPRDQCESRTNSPFGATEPCDPYLQAYIEFDEFGQMWDDGKELDLALKQIEFAQKPGNQICPGRTDIVSRGPIRLVVFVHGWKNNASEQSGNVWGFRDELRAIVNEECQNSPGEALPVVGVYLSWRGDIIHGEILKSTLTYWNRRDVAQKLPGAQFTGVLNRLQTEAHKADLPLGMPNSRSHVVLIGHSFGGLVLERAISQIMAQNIEDQHRERLQPKQSQGAAGVPPTIPPRPKFDLVILLNPAAPATESVQLLTYLKANHVHFCKSGSSGSPCDYSQSLPLIIALKSKGDWATGGIMWGAQNVSRLTHSTRDYNSTSPCIPQSCAADDAYSLPATITKQSEIYTHATVEVREFRSHVVYRCGNANYDSNHQLPAACAANSQKISFCIDNPVGGAKPDLLIYCMSPRAPNPSVDGDGKTPWNRTPFWVAELPVEIVPDHTAVFGPALQKMINALIDYTAPSKTMNATLTAQ